MLTTQPGVKEEDTFVYKAHAPPQGGCGNLINVMKLASHMQEGERTLGSVFRGDQQCSRIKLVSALCDFVRMDTKEALVSMLLQKYRDRAA